MAEPENGGENRFEAPKAPDTSDLDSRLKRLSEETRGVKEQRQSTAAELEAKRKVEREDALGLGRGLQIAYSIIGFPVLGFLAGLAVDHFQQTTYWKGFIGLAGCVLGVITALMLIKQANSET